MKVSEFGGVAIRIAIATLALFTCFSGVVRAQEQGIPGYPNDIRGFDPREVAMLPRYCLFTQDFREHVPTGNNPAEIQRWYDALGPTFHALHHYCYGLMKTNRGTFLARDPKVRQFYLRDAISEYNYVIERAPDDFPLLPEILSRKGENLIRVGQPAVAVEEFERAIELKPDYWVPYAQLSDYYKDSGDKAKARELLERGLASAPDAKGLKRRLDELGAPPAKGKSTTKPPKPDSSSKP
jgi:hypothetical protein